MTLDFITYWSVTMRGQRGYSCHLMISLDNASTAEEAKAVAAWMFPELILGDVDQVDVRSVQG